MTRRGSWSRVRGPWAAAALGLAAWSAPGRVDAQSCSPPSFVPAPSLGATATGPVLTGDFDRDGKVDLLVPSVSGQQLLFFRGRGDGNFDPAVPSPVEDTPGPLVAGDFDRNGTLDVVLVLDHGAANDILAVMRGNGDGTFSPPQTIASGGNYVALVAGGFRNPSWLDLVVSDASGTGALRFYSGNGDGTFGAPSTVATPGAFGALATGDFDRNGKLDLLVANGNGVFRYLGAGGGIFNLNPVAPIATTSAPTPGMVVADFNRDGRPDVAILDPSASSVRLLLDNGAGYTLSSTTVFGAGATIAVGDFDGNGVPDLAVGQQSQPLVMVGLGNGSGGFPSAQPVAVDVPATTLAVASLRGDARRDFVTAGADKVSVRLNGVGFPCPSSSFAKNARMLRTPSSPFQVAQGDFDGDGIPDLAVTSTTGSLFVYQGTGQGYVLKTTIPVGTQLTGVVTLDFDRDGHTDVAVADYGGNRFVVLKGDGAFGFVPFPLGTVATGLGPGPIATGDFNRDGWPDIVTADYASNQLTVALGNGAGFSSVTALTGLSGPAGLAVADLNLDGAPDLVVANQTGNTVSVFNGNGAGGFTTLPSLTGLGQPRWVIATDLNLDGRPDVVVAEGSSNRVSRFLGNGNGTFGGGASTLVGNSPVYVASGDFTGEGFPDVVVVDSVSSDVTVLRGDGAGNLAVVGTFPTGGSPSGVAVVDFNRDGNQDLVVPNTANDNLSLLAGHGDGTFDAASAFDTSTTVAFQQAAIADFDRDGKVDVLATNSAANEVRFYKGDGAGSFTGAISSPGFLSAGPLAVADFTGDGILDIAVGESSGVRFGLGLGTGTFSSGALVPTAFTPTSIAVGDFNRDGNPDLAIGNGNQVTIALGNGGGVFPGVTTYTVGPAGDAVRSVAVVDFDRNGIPDLVVAVTGTSDRLVLLQGLGAGDLTILSPNLATGATPLSIAVADFNRDGFRDLAVANSGSGANSVSLFLGQTGPPYFTPAGTITVGDKPSWVVAADVSGDGKADLVTANFGGQSLSVARGRGDGTFETAEDWQAIGTPIMVAAGDPDRDGRANLVSVQSSTTRSLSSFVNTNCDPRRLQVVRDVSTCNVVATPFVTQPQLWVEDDGGNLAQCVGGAVTASKVPGTGNPAGNLAGTNPVSVPSGVATFADLALDATGRRYRLAFAQTQAVVAARSQALNVGASLAAVGPTQVCASASATWDAGPGWDTVTWRLDGTIVGTSRTQTLNLPAGLYTLRVDTTLDTCANTSQIAVQSSLDLSAVTAVVAGSTVVCPTCSGGTATAVTAGGGPSSFQWGWRATSGGAFTAIAGATGASYTIAASNFSGGAPGAYYLVARATPLCGVPLYSNEVKVVLFTLSGANDVPFVTATSVSGENTLEWVNPAAPYEDTLVRFNAVTGSASCAPPADPGSGTQVALVTGVAGAKGSAPHTGLLNDGTTYCYRVFVHQGGGVFSPGKSITGRPFGTTGLVKWAFDAGVFTLVPPGSGIGQIHVVAQDTLHSVLKGAAGGLWPPAWTPRPLSGPSQGRPSTVQVPAPVNGASRLIFLGTQGGVVYALDADTGGVAWSTALPTPPPAPVQAAPSGDFSFFYQGYGDWLMVGTRNAGVGVANVFYALRLADGGIDWSYDGSADHKKIGMIAAQASVDLPSRRIYFASTAFGTGAGERDTVWCLDLTTHALVWSAELPDVTGSPIVRAARPGETNGRVYVGSWDGTTGEIHALDASTGFSVWSAPPTFSTGGDGPVKSYVAADRSSTTGRLFFATDTKLWALDDPPLSTSAPATPTWLRDGSPLSPSTPVYASGGPYLWIGSSDGGLYELDYATGATLVALPLGDPVVAAQVGSPTLDVREGFLYVGTVNGIVYAVQLP